MRARRLVGSGVLLGMFTAGALALTIAAPAQAVSRAALYAPTAPADYNQTVPASVIDQAAATQAERDALANATRVSGDAGGAKVPLTAAARVSKFGAAAGSVTLGFQIGGLLLKAEDATGLTHNVDGMCAIESTGGAGGVAAAGADILLGVGCAGTMPYDPTYKPDSDIAAGVTWGLCGNGSCATRVAPASGSTAACLAWSAGAQNVQIQINGAWYTASFGSGSWACPGHDYGDNIYASTSGLPAGVPAPAGQAFFNYPARTVVGGVAGSTQGATTVAAHPTRTMTTTYTGTDASGAPKTRTCSFEWSETAHAFAPVPCTPDFFCDNGTTSQCTSTGPGGNGGEVDHVKVTEGTKGGSSDGPTVAEADATQAAKDWQKKYPECSGAANKCVLQVDWLPSGSIDWKHCTSAPEECENWWGESSHGTSSDKYRCQYTTPKQSVTLDLTECKYLRHQFEPDSAIDGNGNSGQDDPSAGGATSPTPTTKKSPAVGVGPDGSPQPSTDPNADPSSGSDPGGSTGTDPSAGGSSDPGAEAGAASSDSGECFPSGWGLLNPIEWVLKPTKCALSWAFVPRPGVVHEDMSGMKEDWAATPPGKLGAWVSGVYGNVPTMSGCAGPLIAFDIHLPKIPLKYSGHPMSACDQPFAGLALTIRLLADVTLGFGTVVAVTRYIGGIVGANQVGVS